jgi:hypothetical protein
MTADAWSSNANHKATSPVGDGVVVVRAPLRRLARGRILYEGDLNSWHWLLVSTPHLAHELLARRDLYACREARRQHEWLEHQREQDERRLAEKRLAAG